MNGDEITSRDDDSRVRLAAQAIVEDYNRARSEAMLLIGDIVSSQDINAMAAAFTKNAPRNGYDSHVHYQKFYRFLLMRDERTGKIDPEQIVLLKELDRLTKKASRFRQSDHYHFGFIKTLAEMTHCLKNTKDRSVSEILALWLFPKRVKACHGGLMTHDRIEYVLKLAKENHLPLKHF